MQAPRGGRTAYGTCHLPHAGRQEGGLRRGGAEQTPRAGGWWSPRQQKDIWASEPRLQGKAPRISKEDVVGEMWVLDKGPKRVSPLPIAPCVASAPEGNTCHSRSFKVL